MKQNDQNLTPREECKSKQMKQDKEVSSQIRQGPEVRMLIASASSHVLPYSPTSQ